MQRNVLAFWSLLRENGGTDATKLSGIFVPVTRELRNRCNEFYWDSG